MAMLRLRMVTSTGYRIHRSKNLRNREIWRHRCFKDTGNAQNLERKKCFAPKPVHG